MKKLSAILITLALIMSMTACAKTGTPGPSTTSPSPTKTSPSPTLTSPSPTTTSPSPTTTSPSPTTTTPTKTGLAGQYKDGTYSAKGDPWENGQEEALVTVKGGKISDVTLKRLNKDGKTEVDYNLFDGKVHNGKTYPNLKEFRVTMAKNMIDKQSTQVDTIAGATTSTKNWKIAAQRALDQAKK
jgi:uncharacterized protein with FMN-binding domain